MALGFGTASPELRGPGDRMHAYLSTCTWPINSPWGLAWLLGSLTGTCQRLALLWRGLEHGNATIHMAILDRVVSLMAMRALRRPSLYILSDVLDELSAMILT